MPDGRGVPPRQLAGCQAFADFATVRGADVDELAQSVPATIGFILESAGGIRSTPALATAAATFLGNTLALLRPDARWRVPDGGPREVGAGRMSFVVDDLVARLLEPGAVDAERLAELQTTISGWAAEESEAALDAAAPHPEPLDRAQRLAGYRRPATPTDTYLDDAGVAIAYGERWAQGEPPHDAYERVSHPERFAPLHAVADALIAFLADEYDARVEEEVAFAADSRADPAQVVRAVRVTPTAPDAAPLTFVFTDFPGVVLLAGALFQQAFPACGCDACDETAEFQAGELERDVFAVVEGGFGEAYPFGVAHWYAHAIVAPDGSGSSSGRGDVGAERPARLERATRILAGLPHGWRAWQ